MCDWSEVEPESLSTRHLLSRTNDEFPDIGNSISNRVYRGRDAAGDQELVATGGWEDRRHHEHHHADPRFCDSSGVAGFPVPIHHRSDVARAGVGTGVLQANVVEGVSGTPVGFVYRVLGVDRAYASNYYQGSDRWTKSESFAPWCNWQHA